VHYGAVSSHLARIRAEESTETLSTLSMTALAAKAQLGCYALMTEALMMALRMTMWTCSPDSGASAGSVLCGQTLASRG